MKRKCLFRTIQIVLILCAIGALSLFIFLISRVSRPSEDSNTAVPVKNTDVPVKNYESCSFSSNDRESEILSLLSIVCPCESLYGDSPQANAARWLIKEDGLQLSLSSQSSSKLIQRYIMALLYYSLHMRLSENKEGIDQFLSSSDECDWSGVSCINHTGYARYVNALNFSSMNLSGSLMEEFEHLPYLEKLDLSNNKITGTVPPQFGLLRELYYLDLSQNSLHGILPQQVFSPKSKLEFLYLNSNRFHGFVPASIANAKNLQYIWLHENEFQSQVPEEFGSLQKLEHLSLHTNILMGTIPEKLFKLQKLWWIDLSFNHLTGTVPSNAFKLSSLQHIYLNDNILEGKISKKIKSLTHLKALWLHANNFTGKFPRALSRLMDLESVLLQNNSFHGKVASSLCNRNRLTKLIALEVDCVDGGNRSNMDAPFVGCDDTCCTKCYR